MEIKHTPGPWYRDGFNPPRVYANHGMEIIAQCDSCGEMTTEQEIANAELIASAPALMAERDKLLELNAEFLAALQLCERALEVRDVEAEEFAVKTARAAIAKATNNGKGE